MAWLHLLCAFIVVTTRGTGGMAYDPFCDNTCPEFHDHFETLGVPDNTTLKEIKKACRGQIKLVHPDKQVGKPEAKREEMKRRHLAVSEACQGLGTHKRHDEYGDEAASGPEVFDEYVALLKLCRRCAADRKEIEGRGEPMGFGGLGSMAYDMAFGPGATTREEYFDRSGRRVAAPSSDPDAGSDQHARLGERFVKREIVCKANVFEEVCQAFDFELVAGGNWVPQNSFGWYDYVPPPTFGSTSDDEDDGDDGEGNGSGSRRRRSGGQVFDPNLGSEEHLPNGATVTSRDGSHFLVMMRDGNLAVYEGSGPQNAGRRPVWESRSFTTHPESFAVLQRDGNLVVKEGRGPDDPHATDSVLWSSNKRAVDSGQGTRQGGQRFGYGESTRQAKVFAVLEDDGNLAVYGAWEDDGYGERECVWASVACPDSIALASSVRVLRNKLRLAVKSALGGLRKDGGGRGRRGGGLRSRGAGIGRVLRGVASWLKNGVDGIARGR